MDNIEIFKAIIVLIIILSIIKLIDNIFKDKLLSFIFIIIFFIGVGIYRYFH